MNGRHASRRVITRGAATLLVMAAALPPLLDTGDIGSVRADSTTLVISEFRVRGPNGANDEFIEIANISGADITIAGAGTGMAVAASDGDARCVIPNGTVIPNRGHYLCVNSVGYSLASYPAGNGTTATGDATYTTDIPDNAGIALFNTSIAADFTPANRIDAVGSTSEANTLYKEGTGYPALDTAPPPLDTLNYSFYRNMSTPSLSVPFPISPTPGRPQDTDDNAVDFVFVDTNGTSAGAGQRLGAPGPENLSSPIPTASLGVSLLDPCVAAASPPNAVRDFTSDPANNSTFGTLDVRRTVTNNTGGNVTRLRARIVDMRTFPAPSGIADLRPRTSTPVVVTVDRAPCGSGTSNVTVQGTTLEQPPSQPNGGGFNSSLSMSTITLATPLANGASIDVRFLFGIQQTGSNATNIIIEALPGGGAIAPGVVCLGGGIGLAATNLCEPTVSDDAYATAEDIPLNVVAPGGVRLNDTGVATATVITGPTHGALTLNPDGSFAYTPDANYNGPDSFTYEATGLDGTTDEGEVTITVTPVVDPPIAVADSYDATEDAALNVPAPGVLANDSDPDGDPLVPALVTGPAYGALVFNPDGSFTYTPNPDFNGTDSFTYHLQYDDGAGQVPFGGAQPLAIVFSDPATVTLAVADVPEVTTPTTTEPPTTPPTTAPPVTPPPTLPPTTVAVPQLPSTGSDTGGSAAWAAALLLVGAALSGVAAASRRRLRR